ELPPAIAGSPVPSPSPSAPVGSGPSPRGRSRRVPSATATPAAPSRATLSRPSPSGSPALVATVRAQTLAVDRMALIVTDETVVPFYRSVLDPVTISAADVRWPGPFARDVKVSARASDGASFTVTGTIAPTDTQLVTKIDALPLAPLNPYAAGTGYAVAGGTLRVESTIKLAPGTYDTSYKVVLNKLAMSGGEGESLFASQFG